MSRPLFSPEELAELALIDAEIDANFRETQEEIVESQRRDRNAVLDGMDNHDRKIAAQKAAYRKAHREACNAYQREYRKANKEKIAAQRAARYRARKEEIKVRNAAYYQAHQEERNAYQREYYRKRKEKAAPGGVNIEGGAK